MNIRPGGIFRDVKVANTIDQLIQQSKQCILSLGLSGRPSLVAKPCYIKFVVNRTRPLQMSCNDVE